jgi:hypothetical protein
MPAPQSTLHRGAKVIANASTIKGKTGKPRESYPNSAPRHIFFPPAIATELMMFSNFV